jgi:hypothetical protein
MRDLLPILEQVAKTGKPKKGISSALADLSEDMY